MKKFWKNYKSTIVLIMSIILGAIVGIVFKEKAQVLKPFGDLFINMLFIIVVPLVFLTITTSISKIESQKRLGKVMTWIVAMFVITSIVALIIGFLTVFKIPLVNPSDTALITSTLQDAEIVKEEMTILERIVSTLSVSDFTLLLSKNNLIALIVVSIITGVAVKKSGEKGKAFKDFLESAREVLMKFIEIIMLYAPIGLGCYFAALVGTFGSEIAVGYFKTFVIYTIVAVLYYLIVYTIYAYIAGGKKGVVRYWKNIIPASITALATCSSAASILVNTECAKKIGVSDDIADTMIPLGTSFHKDGSIIGSVFKIMFLVSLFGTSVSSIKDVLIIFGVAAVANLLITAVPIGGGTISEMMIITLLGYPAAALPILTIIATIIDPAATMLNVVGDSASSMLVARVVDGKNWMQNKQKKVKPKALES